jgi:hypothetical protein
MLEVCSSRKGVLIPNVSLTGSKDARILTSLVVSLLVYNTATVSNIIPRYYYNSGTSGSIDRTRLITGTLVDVYKLK